MKVPFLIIGGGLSGLAAGIRYARYSPGVLLLEKHHRVGGLNSYYYRNKVLLETGLHAVTNFAAANEKHAPLNRLFRQLKLSRKAFRTHQQIESKIHFSNQESIRFSNDFNLLKDEIQRKFPASIDGFLRLVEEADKYDPFTPHPFLSAKDFILMRLGDRLLTDMILCPLLYYGSSVENDMDLSQFVIMFRSIYQEGMFRPSGTIKDFLDKLVHHYQKLGGQIKLSCGVSRIIHKQGTASAVELLNGEVIECDTILSTIGHVETQKLLGIDTGHSTNDRLGFVENIYLFSPKQVLSPAPKQTIIFFNDNNVFNYARPAEAVDFRSGVICFPGNFSGRDETRYLEVRSTHLANFQVWKNIASNQDNYISKKLETSKLSQLTIENITGPLSQAPPTFTDTFTPLTIQRFTAKKDGAIYGSPYKIKDGNIGFSNLFLAGTDQGFLGIVGSMLSGVSIVNQHILPKL